MAWNLAAGSQPCDLSSYSPGSLRIQQTVSETDQQFDILAKLRQFRNDEKFCDTEIIVNGKTFTVHRAVLAAWSPVLASELLTSNVICGKTKLHAVFDDDEAFSDFLDFLYGGLIMLNELNIRPLLDISKNFDVYPLCHHCENFLRGNIHLDNFVSYYFLSLKYSLSQLEEDIANYVHSNISLVIEQDSLLRLTPEKLSTFLSTGKMAMAKQEVQFSLIAGWVGNELAIRENYLLHLLSLVKWVNPIGDLLVQIRRTDNIFMSNEFCLFQLLHNLYGEFGEMLGTFTPVYSKLLNLYKFRVPGLLNLSNIANEIHVEHDMMNLIPISVIGTEIGSCETENIFNTDNVFNYKTKVEKTTSREATCTCAINKDNVTENPIEKVCKIKTVDIGVNTEVKTNDIIELKDKDCQTSLEPPDINSDTLVNLKKCESPNLDMLCHETTEDNTKGTTNTTNTTNDSCKSKRHRRKSEPRKVIDSLKIRVENIGNGKMKLKTVPNEEVDKRKRGRPKKSESERKSKRGGKACKVKDVNEMVNIKQEEINLDDNNDKYNAETDENIDLKDELEIHFGDTDDNKDSIDKESVECKPPVQDSGIENDESYKPYRGRRRKTSNNSGKLKFNEKLKRTKRPYKPPCLPFTCTEEGCSYSTKTDVRLKKHIKSMHNTGIQLHCKKCEYVAPLMKDLCVHMKSHISGPPYKCDFEGCKFQAWRMGILVIHQMNHLGERPYSCDLCNKSFPTANQLSCHRKLHEGRKFVCDVCSKRFTTKGVMKQHRAIHFDKKEYLCDTCGFATKHQSHLISHRKIHTGDLVRCSFLNCNYATPKQGHMTQHLNQHLNIRNHMCQVCGKSFVVRSKLIRHEKIHLAQKLFKCKQCEYTTIRTDRMKLHLTTHGIAFQKKKFNKILPDSENEQEIDYSQFYDKIESAGTEITPKTSKDKMSSGIHDTKPLDIVNAAMNAAAEGRLMETAYTIGMGRLPMDTINVAAVASLEEYAKLQHQVYPQSYERMQTFEQL